MEICTVCQKEFDSALKLRGHLESHKREMKKLVDEKESEIKSEKTEIIVEVKPDFTKYKMLPPPIVEHLELTFGNWLKHFEIGQEYREDFGGYALYIKVPKQFSTEWRKEKVHKYDNETKKLISEKEIEVPDIRWVSLQDVPRAKAYINLVKDYIIRKGFSKGLHLPATNTGLDETKQTVEDYEKTIAGAK